MSAPKWIFLSMVVGLLLVSCGQDDDGPSNDGLEPGLSNAEIVENPNNRLSAFVDVATEEPAEVTLEIRRDAETVRTLGPTGEGAEHHFEVLGLHAETTHEFGLKATTAGGQTEEAAHEYTTGPLPEGFPPLHVETSKPEKAADGIRLLSLYRWELGSEGRGYDTNWGMIVGIDKTGEVVWYHRADHWTWNAERLSNGNLIYIEADEQIHEIDMMGQTVNTWDAAEDLGREPDDDTYGIHHSVIEQDDGNFVTLSTELQQIAGYLGGDGSGSANVIGDVALEFNRDGEVLDSWTMFDILSDFTKRKRRGSRGAKWDDEYGKNTNDWSHANALTFGDTPGTLVASLRHQDWVVKWNREHGRLLWRLGPEGDFEFPEGSDGEFNYHQHAPNWLENGNLMIYDNGNFRESVEPGERFYTRAVEFELDTSGVDIENGEKGTVKQVWELKHPPKYFAPHVGDAELLPNDTVMVSDGGLLEKPEKCITFDGGALQNNSWSCISNPGNLNWARLLEVTHDEQKEVVLEVWIKDKSDDDPRGYTMYRAEYLEDLYPDGFGSSDGDGGDGGGGDDGDDGDSDATDTDSEPPEIRDAQVSIQGEYASQVDLGSGDATRILPVPAEAEVTIFARDDETSAENLDVGLIDGEGESLEKQSEEFRNGIWRFTVELAPGMDVRAQVEDGAANATESEHTLRLPTREEAVVGSWERRLYTNEDEPAISGTYDWTLHPDGTWEGVRGEIEREGEYSVEGDELNWRRTYQSGGENPDSDRSTAEVDRVGPYYIDEQFFSIEPWFREGSGSAIEGTWSRTWQRYETTDGEREVAADVEETLVLEKNQDASNTWKYTLVETAADSTESTTTASGTYETLELTTNYGENFGTFFVQTTTHRDGSELSEPETSTELYRMPLDMLLISPYVRTSDVSN